MPSLTRVRVRRPTRLNEVLMEQGWPATAKYEANPFRDYTEVHTHDQLDFIYKVRLRSYVRPVCIPGSIAYRRTRRNMLRPICSRLKRSVNSVFEVARSTVTAD